MAPEENNYNATEMVKKDKGRLTSALEEIDNMERHPSIRIDDASILHVIQIMFMLEIKNSRAEEIVRNLFIVNFNQRLEEFRKVDTDNVRSIFRLTNEPLHFAGLCTNEETTNLCSALDEKQLAVVKKIILFFAQILESVGRFNEATNYYYFLEIEDKVDELFAKPDLNHEGRMAAIKNTPDSYYKELIKKFLEETKDCPLMAEEERNHIIDKARQEIQELIQGS